MIPLGAHGLAENALLYKQAIYGSQIGVSHAIILLASCLHNVSPRPIHGKSLCKLLVSLPVDALLFVSH